MTGWITEQEKKKAIIKKGGTHKGQRGQLDAIEEEERRQNEANKKKRNFIIAE